MSKHKETITIFYTSDIHGHVLPINYGNNDIAHIGLAKYATIVKSAKENKENVIVIDNGDLIQGTPLMTHYIKQYDEEENPMVGIMNQLELDAAVIGNHEFNFGKKILYAAVQEAKFPWLSANTIDKNRKKPLFGPPYTIKKLPSGIKVAIVGVTTHYIPNWESPEHIEGIEFTDAFSTLKKWVTHIHEVEQPDLLIASYHGGFERDLTTGEPTEPLTGENQAYKMCEQIDGIDILLTGHQHRHLTGKVNDVLVLQPGKNGEAYGEAHIEFSYENEQNKWALINKQVELNKLDEVKADEDIVRYIEPLETSTQKWLDQPIGYIDGNMTIKDSFQARLTRHPFIALIQQIQMEASGADISVASLLNNETTGFDSTVTMRDVVSNYMYPNTLTVLELTGEAIRAALEKSANYFTVNEHQQIDVNPAYIEPKPQHYNYDMWDGINYTIHVQNPVGSRVKDITYKGKPLEDSKRYNVVLNNYRAGGGGEYDMFKNKRIVKEIQQDAVQLIHDYFEKHGTVQVDTTSNFIVKK